MACVSRRLGHRMSSRHSEIPHHSTVPLKNHLGATLRFLKTFIWQFIAVAHQREIRSFLWRTHIAMAGFRIPILFIPIIIPVHFNVPSSQWSQKNSQKERTPKSIRDGKTTCNVGPPSYKLVDILIELYLEVP